MRVLMEQALYPLTFLIGLSIGATGIGGVAPAMDAWMDIPIQVAMATAMASFVASGAVGTFVYQLRLGISWRSVPILASTVVISAFVGSMTLQVIPGALLRSALAFLMIAAGLRQFVGSRQAEMRDAIAPVRPASLAAVGLVTGWGSAVTASGGPLILLPLLVLLRVPVQTAVGLCQVVQVPIGVAASFGNHIAGQLDLLRAVPIALVLGAGTVAGALIGDRVPTRTLQMTVATALITSGLLYAF
jgi:hypothetical protein